MNDRMGECVNERMREGNYEEWQSILKFECL